MIFAVILLRHRLGDLVDRVKKVTVGAATVDLHNIEVAATEIARSTIDPELLAENVSVRVTEAGGSPSPANDAIEDDLRSALKEDEAQRREQIKVLVGSALAVGWDLARRGYEVPKPLLTWQPDGTAELGWKVVGPMIDLGSTFETR